MSSGASPCAPAVPAGVASSNTVVTAAASLFLMLPPGCCVLCTPWLFHLRCNDGSNVGWLPIYALDVLAVLTAVATLELAHVGIMHSVPNWLYVDAERHSRTQHDVHQVGQCVGYLCQHFPLFEDVG